MTTLTGGASIPDIALPLPRGSAGALHGGTHRYVSAWRILHMKFVSICATFSQRGLERGPAVAQAGLNATVEVAAQRLGWQIVDGTCWDVCWMDTSVSLERCMRLSANQARYRVCWKTTPHPHICSRMQSHAWDASHAEAQPFQWHVGDLSEEEPAAEHLNNGQIVSQALQVHPHHLCTTRAASRPSGRHESPWRIQDIHTEAKRRLPGETTI